LFQTNDLKSFRAKALEFKNNPVNVYQSIEADINTFGYRLVNMKKMDEAIDMFKLNTELYPESANAFDSLGEAYANQGNKEEAIKSYEKALKIDPAFASSVEALRKLKGN
jgi:tetratricopeptide (TPR) repeat protein